jgi:hypothetical protein
MTIRVRDRGGNAFATRSEPDVDLALFYAEALSYVCPDITVEVTK